MNDAVEKVLALLDGFRMSDEMTYSAYSALYDEISLLDDLLKEQEKVIQCKDCKYNTGNCRGLYVQFVTCYKTGTPHKEDWFCADGERKVKRDGKPIL